MKKVRLIYQSAPRFFGLTPDNRDIVLEQIFILMQHLNFSYKDAYFLPVWQRTWFIGKLKDNIEKQQQHQNTNPNRQNSSNNIFKKQF
jgi:hypothetical protein